MKGNTLEKKIQKLSDLWLVGKMVNRIGIYGSKVAEGLSAFQRRSYLRVPLILSKEMPHCDTKQWMWINMLSPTSACSGKYVI